ncbi:hypothetical protein, partial [Thiorhodococcus fuscus]
CSKISQEKQRTIVHSKFCVMGWVTTALCKIGPDYMKWSRYDINRTEVMRWPYSFKQKYLCSY